MQEFVVGQRWISDAELKLGLGTVIDVADRTVDIYFKSVDESRTYSQQSAPLTRIVFSRGDQIRDENKREIVVTSVSETDGLLIYGGEDAEGQQHEVSEVLLDHQLQLHRPSERLLSQQVDKDSWFRLRYQSLGAVNAQSHSPLRGLSGTRVSLIPHQLYIAHEVSQRYAPRVLLADEVGLGKTIEAGMIIHQQLVCEHAGRVLIIVPESLVHQWFVELLRRFNLHFSIFDQERYQASLESNEQQNPFHDDQLVLCSLAFITEHAQVLEDALAANWDMLVVDEAHHLDWQVEEVSAEYLAVERLADSINSVLLLTATPEQLGKAGHFARLRLLDPRRFPDFQSFVEEEENYEPLANLLEDLFENNSLDASLLKKIGSLIGEQTLQDSLESAQGESQARETLLNKLLDRHGTGRVLFRNTRAAVSGFPQRKLHAYPLPENEPYEGITERSLDSALSPEREYAKANPSGPLAWTNIDRRIDWLIEKLGELKPQKVLLIASSADTVLELAECLRVRAGMHMAVFHEGMSIVERDRAAAYFADMEEGCQALLCSEIGSEGRNFQFAHHLVFFDLPQNPDLLEQRIGRLDRIGQQLTVEIHVPYFEKSAQEIMFLWLHRGLNAFERSNPASSLLFDHFQSQLMSMLSTRHTDIDALVADTRTLGEELEEKLQKGRDRLLEYNSCRPAIAEQLTELAKQADQKSNLAAYMESVFDCFGVHSEEHSHARYILRPGEDMLTHFPYLQEEGMTVTYDRDIALVHEDVHFLSWEHPMVTAAMDAVLSSEMGNTSVTAIEYEGLDAGLLFLEAIYVFEPAGHQDLQTTRYLPATLVRTMVNEQGLSVSAQVTHAAINLHALTVDRETAVQIIQARARELKGMIQYCEREALNAAPVILEKARNKALKLVEGEIERLRALSKVNKNVREEEIAHVIAQRDAIDHSLKSTEPRLDALRVIVST